MLGAVSDLVSMFSGRQDLIRMPHVHPVRIAIRVEDVRFRMTIAVNAQEIVEDGVTDAPQSPVVCLEPAVKANPCAAAHGQEHNPVLHQYAAVVVYGDVRIPRPYALPLRLERNNRAP